ncbi:hypothetical protein ACSJHT_22965, partial [Escherichia coli]
MNILFTESSPNIGGQELQAVAQMKALKKMGHSVLLVCRENGNDSNLLIVFYVQIMPDDFV